VLLQSEERGDVRVREGGEDLGLALEAAEAAGVGEELRGQDLEGDVAFQAPRPRYARPMPPCPSRSRMRKCPRRSPGLRSTVARGSSRLTGPTRAGLAVFVDGRPV
jgi:hypothetical protein